MTECMIKAKSKQEVYRVLSTEGGIYLAPYKECNYEFIVIFSDQILPEHLSKSFTLLFGCSGQFQSEMIIILEVSLLAPRM